MVRQSIPDAFCWAYCPNGLFSVSLFRRCLEELKMSESPVNGLLWQGFCPPKVEIFCWQVILGKVSVKEKGKVSKGCGWEPPTVDGSAVGCPGRAVSAIQRACNLLVSKTQLTTRSVEVVSDSKTAVSWVNGEDFGNVKLVQQVYDIREFLRTYRGVLVVYKPRGFNSLADSLAKAGSNRSGDRLEWDGL
ncbi:hypothetical protein Dsin_003378 [Dipteronia sinensis]|uniref:RNase H type-1 domain-containing protein n=1 Tax=Dipteronia sinensis TaxID=43782 RepID=A0AAE0B7W9_9ROSI|nr:hypothetical protein Dsin_003378 [Dipteronia sinensis]